MGLDCRAYKNLRQMTEEEIQYDEYTDEMIMWLNVFPKTENSFG